MNDLRLLGEKLFNYINNFHFKKSKYNYCYIDKVEIDYDINQAFSYTFTIGWGRYYPEDNEKSNLNEDHITKITIDIENLNNYDVILGQFIERIKED